MQTRKSRCFFKCTHHNNNKGQEQNTSSKSDPKEIEIYELCDKVFKLTIVNKLNALQRKTNTTKQNQEKCEQNDNINNNNNKL